MDLSKPLQQSAAEKTPRFLWILFFLFWVFHSTNIFAAIALTSDGPVSGSISVPGEVDEFDFTASTGDAINLGAGATSGNLLLNLYLYNPDGTLARSFSGNQEAAINCHSTSSTCQLSFI